VQKRHEKKNHIPTDSSECYLLLHVILKTDMVQFCQI
jgi:hypothetical protein